MTLRCPWCENDVEVSPDDVVVTARSYRWSHCGQPIIRPARSWVGNASARGAGRASALLAGRSWS